MPVLVLGALPKGSVNILSHQHALHEIILVTEGQGVRVIGDAEYPFHAGEIAVIPPDVPHKSYSDSEYMELYIQTDHPIPFAAGNAPHGAIFLEDDEQHAVSALMQLMFYRYMQGEKNDSTLFLMLDLLLQLLAEKCAASQRDPVVDTVCRLLALHYNDPQLTLAALLESTGYNKDYIRRRFISVCGVTPGEYLTSLRIEHAKRLLKRKKELQFSVADIGEMCGYYDPRYFSRVFKKQVGVTPAQFVTLPAE